MLTVKGNDIRFNGKPARWHDVVASTFGKDDTVLKEFGTMRKRIVDTMLEEVKIKVCKNCKWQSVGSENPTSDYDVSVYGPDADLVVKEFNSRFRKLYKCESAEMFDTNIYAFPAVSPDFTLFHHLLFNGTELEYITNPKDPTKRRKDMLNQHTWACVKLLMHIQPSELEQIMRKVQGPIKQCLDKAFLFLKGTSKIELIAVSNQKYAKCMHKVGELRKKFRNGEGNDDMILNYKEALANANFYGSETYFSLGPFYHVVVRQQMEATTMPIEFDEYIDSFIENMGDVFKLLNQTYEVCTAAVVDISKYWFRALDALNGAKKLGKNEQPALKRSETIYRTFRGKTAGNIRLEEEVSGLLELQKMHTCDITTLREKLFNYTMCHLNVLPGQSLLD